LADRGRLYGVGIGPGDTELLTIKAVNVLKSVDIIFSPRSAPKKDSIARRIVEPVLNSNTEFKELVFPMTKDRKELEKHWSEAADEVAKALSEGKSGAFITLGDPFFYSTYIYLYRKLKEEHPEIEIVTLPGVSSPFAAAAAAGIPIAVGDEKLAIVPLPEVIGEIWHYLETFDTVIILKVGERLRAFVKVLSGFGLLDNAVLVQKASHDADEKIIMGLSKLDDEMLDNAGYLSTVIVKRDVPFV
jgi:precorrin-2/cobalt-factor-2 C20-methyltransferase